jgi:predicted amidophosphoribosyltransferase
MNYLPSGPSGRSPPPAHKLAVPDRLAPLRAVFWNPDRTSGQTCAVCTTPAVRAGFPICWQCREHSLSPHPVADVVAPITYAVEGSQAMRDLYNYKEVGRPLVAAQARDRLFDVLFLSLERHLQCIADLGGPISHVATVPSSGGRGGSHPVDQMLDMFGAGFTRVPLTYVGPKGLAKADRRTLAPERFATSTPVVEGQHVLLLDDSWVSGAHLQSTAAALHLAGARWVSAVPIGRVVSSTYGDSKSYLDSHTAPPFDPDVCPLTGGTHP